MRTLKNAEEAFIGITLIVVTFVLFINIILRYFFSANTTWAEEFIRFAIIWITFIGSSVCFRRGKHVGVEVLMEVLPGKGKKVLHIFINVLAILFMVFLVKFGLDLVAFGYKTGQAAATLPVKMYWIYIAIPAGALLSIFHLVIDSFIVVTNKKELGT